MAYAFSHRVAGFFERVRMMTVRDVSVDVFGEVAYAFCRFHFEGDVKGQPHIAEGRVTFLLRRKRGRWQVIHYHESRPGPLPMPEEGGAR